MKSAPSCGCARGTQPDTRLEAQVRQLAQRQEDLAGLFAKYMSEAGLDRDRRVANAVAMASDVVRIVGGVATLPGEFDDCCIIGRENTNGTVSWFCSGVLIHPSIVITAAHCAELTPNIVGLKAQRISDLAAAEIIQTRPIVRHPKYPSTDPLNDIGVLVLRQPAAVVAPTPMASAAQIAAAVQTTLVGFGNDDLQSTHGFGVKRKVTVAITGLRRNPAENLDALEHGLGFESDLEFVAGGSGFDSCNGDSGGPAYVADAAGRLHVAGVTSRAVDHSSTGCGEGGIYSRVDVHRGFISEVAHGFGIAI